MTDARRNPAPERFGDYTVLLELARGGMAELYLGRRSGVGGFEKLVAIKRILPHLAEDAQFRALFLNEARIAAQLSHPHVCQVYELDEMDGELFLAMEYLDGVGWDVLVEAAPRGEPMLALVSAVLGQACAGLHYAHTLHDATGQPTPIVHRDVSPQNLFVTVDGVCKVLDFGIAKMAKDGPRTRTGVLKGKLPYMAPEQIQGDPVDGRTDQFALGVCLWEALTGKRLYDRETDFKIWKAITEEPVPSVGEQYPAAIDRVIARTLAKHPDGRYPNLRAFADDLARVIPPLEERDVAAVMQTACAERIAKRQHRVAAAVSESREASRALRTSDVEDATASATVDLRGAAPSAASTVDIRHGTGGLPPTVPALANVPRIAPDDSGSVSIDESLVLPQRRRRRLLMLVIGGLAAVMVVIGLYLALLQ